MKKIKEEIKEINKSLKEIHSKIIKISLYKELNNKSSKLKVYTTAKGNTLVNSPSRELQKIIQKDFDLKLNLHFITDVCFSIAESIETRKSYYVKNFETRVRGVELSEKTIESLKEIYDKYL